MAQDRRKDPLGRVLREGESWKEKEKRYIYRWRPYKGAPQKCIQAKDLNTLREKEKEIKRNILNGIQPNTITLNDMIKKLMELKTGKADNTGLRVTTKTNYTYMWEKYVKDSFGRRQISGIKYSDVKEFYLSLLDSGLKIATIDNIHTVIRPALQLAVKDRLIPSNPADGLIGEIKKERRLSIPKREALTAEEQESFLNYVNHTALYHHWYPLFITFFWTGMRESELFGLTWDDVDFKNKTISINHQIVYHLLPDGTCGYVAHTPKTDAGIRVIPMFPLVEEALLYIKESQMITHPIQPTIAGYTNFIFLNREGMLHKGPTVNKAIQRIVRDFNKAEETNAIKEKREARLIRSFSCHIMRHSCATRFFEAGANQVFVKEFFGHKEISTTIDIYTDLMPSKKKEMAEELVSKLFPTPTNP